MKKLLFITSLILSLQAGAIVQGNGNEVAAALSTTGPFSFSSTTTYLPTIIAEDAEIDLSSPEVQERIQAELNGDIEPVILNLIHENN